MNQAQQGIGARRHGQPPGKAGASLATQSKTELALLVRKPRGAARRTGGDGPQRLGKGLARTAGIAAAETAHPDQEPGRTPLPGQVHQPALVSRIPSFFLLQNQLVSHTQSEIERSPSLPRLSLRG